MHAIKNYLSSRRIMLFITLAFLLIRLPGLGSTFLLYDERDTVLTQYSLAKTGRDLYGVKTPLVFDHISPHAPFLAMYYGVPFFALGLSKTVETARLIYLLPFTLTPLLVFELVYALSKKKSLSTATAAVFAFSPWVFHISRLALEFNLSFPLFLGALLAQQKKKAPLALILYFLSFFTYQGIRPMIPLAMLFIEATQIRDRKALKKAAGMFALYLLFFCALFAAGGIIEKNTAARGSSEIVFLNSLRLTQEVDYNRFVSRAPSFLKPLFDNKAVASADYVFRNAMQGLNTSFLFGTGDYVPVYANGVMGQFFPLLSVFLIAGLIMLGKTKNREYYFVSSLAVIGLAPSLVNNYSVTFSIRSLLAAVGFSFLIALGILESLKAAKRLPRPAYGAAVALCAVIFAYQAGTFYYRYSFQRPVWQSETFNENERSLAGFVTKNAAPYTIKTNSAFAHYLSYLFLKNLDKAGLEEAQRVLQAQTPDFRDGSLLFSECEAGEVSFLSRPENLIVEESCLSPKTKELIRLRSLPYGRIDYADYNFLDTSRRLKYYVFN